MDARREVMTLTRQPTAQPPRRKLQYRVRVKDDQLGAQIEWAGQILSRIRVLVLSRATD
jgi:hypothetical protein